ncbi:MAG: hypothetical protein WBK19_16010 [Azonexus sp.]
MLIQPVVKGWEESGKSQASRIKRPIIEGFFSLNVCAMATELHRFHGQPEKPANFEIFAVRPG